MKLEQQVCNSELAKKLEELGVKQESLFIWVEKGWYEPKWNMCKELEEVVIFSADSLKREKDGELEIAYNTLASAFTVAELGEILPLYLREDADKGISFSVETNCLHIRKTYDNKGWICAYSHRTQSANTEADARAKMLIHLIENNLINPH